LILKIRKKGRRGGGGGKKKANPESGGDEGSSAVDTGQPCRGSSLSCGRNSVCGESSRVISRVMREEVVLLVKRGRVDITFFPKGIPCAGIRVRESGRGNFQPGYRISEHGEVGTSASIFELCC